MIVFSKCTTSDVLGEPFGRWKDFRSIEMMHMKKTCPNPHSGEKYHSFPVEGIIIDVINKRGLYVTYDEYETMMKFTSQYVEIEFQQLIFTSDILEEYRGAIAATKFDV